MYVPCGGGGQPAGAGVVAISASNSKAGSISTASATADAYALVNPSSGFVYAAAGATNLSVINGTAAIGWLNVGPDSSPGVYDPLSSDEIIPVQSLQLSFGSTGYAAVVGMLGPISDSGTIKSVSVTLKNGFQDAEVEWADRNVASSKFAWGTNRTYGLPAPEANGTSIELNALSAGTLYYFRISDTTASGEVYVTTGTFRTAGALPSSIVGWAYYARAATDHYLILQDGAVAATIPINLTARCGSWTSSGHTTTKVRFVGVRTNSTGFYNLTFPLRSSAFVNDGSEEYFYMYGGNGTCATYGPGGWLHATNSHYLVSAGGVAGVWTDDADLPATLNSSNYVRPFVLDPNPVGYTAAVLALVNTPYAQCGSALTVSSTQTVIELVGGNGHSNSTTVEQTFGGAFPGWGVDSGVSIGWQVGGILNVTAAQAANAWATDHQPALSSAPYTTTDWLSDTTFNLGSPAAPYFPLEVVPSYQQANPEPYDVNQTTTFSSTSGTELSVDIGVNYELVSAGISVDLQYTTTVEHSVRGSLDCELYDPSTTRTAVFYATFNGGSLSLAAVIHIWLAGFCPVGETEC